MIPATMPRSSEQMTSGWSVGVSPKGSGSSAVLVDADFESNATHHSGERCHRRLASGFGGGAQ